MLQPFELFKQSYIAGLRKLNKRYFVSQTCSRAPNNIITENKTVLLLTDYDTLGAARIHKNAIKHDIYAAIFDLENENHFTKLQEMLSINSKYIIYWSVVKDAAALKKIINQKYKDKMRKYIEQNTNWRINKDAPINPIAEITFGEIFITLKHAGQQIRLKFEEIENA